MIQCCHLCFSGATRGRKYIKFKNMHWDDPEGWNGEGGGMGNTCIPMADSF